VLFEQIDACVLPQMNRRPSGGNVTRSGCTTTPTAPGSRSGGRASSVTWATLVATRWPSAREQTNSRMQLREAQRQALAASPATGRGPNDERIGSSVLAEASETSFDRSSCKARNVVRLA